LGAGLRVDRRSPQVQEFPPATTIARGERFECALAAPAGWLFLVSCTLLLSLSLSPSLPPSLFLSLSLYNIYILDII
jgi:hypothetical protein